MTLRVGNYIFYPAFFILLFVIFVLFFVGLFLFKLVKEKKAEKAENDKYRITQWQRKHVVRLCKDYLRDNSENEDYMDALERLERYISDSTYWNMDEMIDIEKNMVRNITLILFFTAQESYLVGDEDDAVMLLHTLDMVNGGPDNPDYEGGEYPWIGDDVDEMRNHQDMTEEETRTLHLWFSSVSTLASFVDPDLGKIAENSPAPSYCKRISQEEMEACMEDLVTIVDIRGLQPSNRDVVCKAVFFNTLIMLNGIFNSKDEGMEEILYVDEGRRYLIRSLTAAIDNQLYSDVVESIEY